MRRSKEAIEVVGTGNRDMREDRKRSILSVIKDVDEEPVDEVGNDWRMIIPSDSLVERSSNKYHLVSVISFLSDTLPRDMATGQLLKLLMALFT